MKKRIFILFFLYFILCDCICLENIKKVSYYLKEQGYTTNFNEPFEGTTFIDITNQKEIITIIVIDDKIASIEYYNHNNYTFSCYISNPYDNQNSNGSLITNRIQTCKKSKPSFFEHSGLTKKELVDYAQSIYNLHNLEIPKKIKFYLL